MRPASSKPSLLVLAGVLMASTPAMTAPWVRGYVVTNYEPAWYFGGSPRFVKAGIIEPGSDCPKGTFPDLDYSQILRTPWRNAADVAALSHPPRTDLLTIQAIQVNALTFRGYREDIDVYINPFTVPDPGIQEVTGKIAEGFDLDHNSGTGGFTSPDGQKGIDNAYYRAFGCAGSFRGVSHHASISARADDKMAEGLYTMVIRVSGNKDPLNDDEATVEVGYSPDHVVKGPNGSFIGDYSFRIDPHREYSRVKASVKNGVVESEQADELHMPRFSWYPNHYGDADFHKGRLRFALDDKGNASGLVGGYRDWRDLFAEDNFTQDGATVEQREHQDSVAMYYALKRNADGMADPRTGQKMGISIAYRFKAVPAFVVDPAALPPAPPVSPCVQNLTRLYVEHRAAFYKALATRVVQPIPVGSDEASIGRLLRHDDGSWSLKTGATILAQCAAPTPQKPVIAPKPSRQVRNEIAPALVASTQSR